MSLSTFLTPAHLAAFAKLVSGLPVDELVALLDGNGTVDDLLDLDLAAVKIVAEAYPPGSIVAGEVGLALEALKFLLDAGGVGSSPVKGGVPTAFPPGGGPGPYRGR